MLGSVLLLVATFAFAEPAAAGSAEANAAFARGTQAYQHGDNRGAAAAFETAYRLQPHGVAKYSAALAWEAARELPRAADDYALALASGQLDATQEEDAQQRLGKLEKNLGRVELTAPEGTTIKLEHVDGALVPTTVHLAPGEHTLEARFADGSKRETRVKVSAGQSVHAALEPVPREKTSTPSAVREAPTPEKVTQKEPSSSQKTVGYVMVGGAAVASLAAVVLGSRALSRAQRVQRLGLPRRGRPRSRRIAAYRDERDLGRRWRARGHGRRAAVHSAEEDRERRRLERARRPRRAVVGVPLGPLLTVRHFASKITSSMCTSQGPGPVGKSKPR